MKEFLKSVADHYKQYLVKSDGTTDCFGLENFLFVFPNRRSSMFFGLYLTENMSVPILAPEMTTISELFPRLNKDCQYRILDRIELLFHLYDVYKKVSGSDESFDSFMFWGEMILSDFNDTDKYLVDAKLLFKNLKDIREIEEEFEGLEPEQVKIIKTFWTNFNPSTKGTSKDAFRQTWQIMYELYTSFRNHLLERNCAYDGMLQRMMVEQLKKNSNQLTYNQELDKLTTQLGKKIVFVGLTALSKTEIELMKYLDKFKIAEFCWDYADSRLNDRNSHASFFKSSTIDIFPNVLSEEELKAGLVPDSERKIEVIEVPSGVGQTIQAANILKEWSSEKTSIIDTASKDKSDRNNAFHTAVVLPDEKMLLPLLYSIPKEFEPFNITMGYSLKSTTIATFIENLSHLQNNKQKDKSGNWTFYHKNVLPLLNCNFLQKMTDGMAVELSEKIVRKNQFRVQMDMFKGNHLLEAVFAPCNTGNECSSYLNNILTILANHAQAELEAMNDREERNQDNLFAEEEEEDLQQEVFSEIEREFLYTYIKLVNALKEKTTQFDTTITATTFFSLLRKLSVNETVAFSGEPLSGLQVMGVLETRDVDFDNIIILSMNEGVFPAKPSSNSFIPMNLRNGFGMPTQLHKDAVYAYHFYRLISRARNVVMIYDSRSEGMQSGEPSRYIKQLSYLYGVKPKMKSIQYNIGIETTSGMRVKKTEAVMSRLNECLAGGTRTLSASALKCYINCPMQFYLQFVEGLREENEIEESIDDRIFGSILHETMDKLYEQSKGKLINSARIDAQLKNKNILRMYIEKAFYKITKNDTLNGYLSLVEEILLTYVIDILQHDKTIGDFVYIDSEKKETKNYIVKDDQGKEVMSVQIKAVYDRIDQLKDGTLRIVDYKTGKAKVSKDRDKLIVPEISTIFSENSKCSEEAFQVMLYSILYNADVVSPHLYFVREFHKDPGMETALQYEPDNYWPIKNFSKYEDQFRTAFDKMILDIFDTSKDFTQTDNKKQCEYCIFKEICKRD